jgi:lipid A 3-O-deacylase
MLRSFALLAACLPSFLIASPVAAQAVFVGVTKHAVETPFTFDIEEGGVDVQAGYRFAPIKALSAIGSPAPYVIASVNTRGDTSFAGAGLAWTIGKGPVYLRPGLGLVIHDGPDYRVDSGGTFRTDLGSRVLFEPELGLGVRVNERVSVEAQWTHISHAQLFNGDQNPGIDMIGLRLNYRTD